MRLALCIVTLLQCLLFVHQAQADCNRPLNLQPDNPPQKLSETGIFEDLSQLKTCPLALEYKVNLPFWSDGAVKRRWIILPKDGKIEFKPEDPWKYPVGTILIKHFELKTSATQQVKVETRILMNLSEDDWYGYSYQWQNDQKDAVLLDDSATKEYEVLNLHDVNGSRKQTWWFPSQKACLQCHNSWSGYVLGPQTGQLNLTKNGETKNQLELWNEKNYFSSNIGKSSQYNQYSSLTDPTQPLEKKVKSYLATNCVQCHQPDSPVRSKIDFRFKTPLTMMNLIGHKPNAGDMEIPDALLVSPGKKEASILWHRLKTSTTLRMPPIGNKEVDLEAVNLIGAWIDQLPVPKK
ncbi:MAG: hypothetical protein ABI041_20350 [Bdellovibrionia bacterium]